MQNKNLTQRNFNALDITSKGVTASLYKLTNLNEPH